MPYEPLLAPVTLNDLPHSPRHRYQVQLRSRTPEQAANWPYRQEVCADRLQRDAVVFYTGAHAVARYRQMTSPPRRIA